MIPVKLLVKILLYAVFVVSLILLLALGFSTAFMLALGVAVTLFFYFTRVESHFHSGGLGMGSRFGRATFLPVVLAVSALLFIINPAISETRGNLGRVVSQAFGISNTDVRPSFSATLDISKAVLSQAALLGSGPNTFRHDWLIFRPVGVNSTAFWSVAFPFGAGFLATQIATTGILGTALWLAFLALLLVLTYKVLSQIPESRAARFTLISTLLTTLFLWAGSLLYTPSAAMLILAFLTTGLLLALMKEANMFTD